MAYVQGKVADQYDLALTVERAKFHADRPHWEQENLAAIKDAVEVGDTVYDIGAEQGDFSCLYAQWSESPVVLVEPSEWYWPQMRGIFNANKIDPPALSFVGFAGRQTRPTVAKPIEGWPIQTQRQYQITEGFSHLQERPDIQCISIDDLAKQLPPNVIVIDVEGSETEVLAGARRTLKEHRPTVFCSVHPDFLQAYDSSVEQLDKYMNDLGYNKTVLKVAHEVHTKYSPKD